jgi:YVTN family beta-propeller protein
MGTTIRPTRVSRRLVALGACSALAILVAGLGAPGAQAAGRPPAARPRATSRLALRGPSGLAVDGGNLWVTNRRGNTVTEINPATHHRIRTIGTAREAFVWPVAIVADGSDLFVANKHGAGDTGSITEINASRGTWVRTISARRDGFDHPVALARRGQDLFVVNQGGSITELATPTGAFIRKVSGARYHFANPVAITVAGDDLWVADDSTANTVTEINAGTGRLVRTISNHGLSGPDGIGYGDGRIWVADSTSYAATEINAGTGAVITTVNDSTGPYGFNQPSVTMVRGGNVYVVSPPGNTPMITKLSATDGTAAWFECNTNNPSPDFVKPSALAMIGTDLFVANEGVSTTTLDGNGAQVGNSVTELSLTDGGNAVAEMTNSSV